MFKKRITLIKEERTLVDELTERAIKPGEEKN